MAWRGERDPYRVWLSEVILQQTRVAQGAAYYARFVRSFPTVHELAAASEDEVMSHWQGLGYYSRARNLHRAAKRVSAAGGTFPVTAAALRALPGVGPYTAAAIASFAYDEPVAVVDGNVYRVLARYLGVDEAIDTTPGQREFRALAAALLPVDRPAAYNQAIMDFGALVCTPKSPDCDGCPLRENCVAFREGTVAELPKKVGKVRRRTRHIEYLHLTDGSARSVLRKRTGKDIWQGLYDFPEAEPANFFSLKAEFEAALEVWDLPARAEFLRRTEPVKHVLSHQDLHVRFWHYRLLGTRLALPQNCSWMTADEVTNVGLPRVVERYLREGMHELTLGFA